MPSSPPLPSWRTPMNTRPGFFGITRRGFLVGAATGLAAGVPLGWLALRGLPFIERALGFVPPERSTARAGVPSSSAMPGPYPGPRRRDAPSAGRLAGQRYRPGGRLGDGGPGHGRPGRRRAGRHRRQLEADVRQGRRGRDQGQPRGPQAPADRRLGPRRGRLHLQFPARRQGGRLPQEGRRAGARHRRLRPLCQRVLQRGLCPPCRTRTARRPLDGGVGQLFQRAA